MTAHADYYRVQFSYPDYQPAFGTDHGRSRREKAQEIVEPLPHRVDQAVRLRGQPTAGPARCSDHPVRRTGGAASYLSMPVCEIRLVDDLRAVMS
jgi:hypothetical protein